MDTLEQRLLNIRDDVGHFSYSATADDDGEQCTASEVIDAVIAELQRLHGEAKSGGESPASQKTAERPCWFPTLMDARWVAGVRADHPKETDGMSDEFLRESYGNGGKYADTWDHLGDARHDYEKLADAYLELLDRTKEGE